MGVCWYGPVEWERVKATATDPEVFENSFAEWEAMATEALSGEFFTSVDIAKVIISPDEFFAWCHLRAKVNHATTRAEYVAEQLQKAPPSVT